MKSVEISLHACAALVLVLSHHKTTLPLALLLENKMVHHMMLMYPQYIFYKTNWFKFNW